MDDSDSSQQSPDRPPSDEPPSSGAGLRVDILDASRSLHADDAEWLRHHVEAACTNLRLRGEVRAKIVDDDAMAEAHDRYSGVAGTTDVLTFDLSEPNSAETDVDLLLCIDVATRQAEPRGHRAREELLLYAVHGVLHTLGYDDHDEDAAARMHAEEDRILNAIGVGTVYAKPTAEAPR